MLELGAFAQLSYCWHTGFIAIQHFCFYLLFLTPGIYTTWDIKKIYIIIIIIIIIIITIINLREWTGAVPSDLCWVAHADVLAVVIAPLTVEFTDCAAKTRLVLRLVTVAVYVTCSNRPHTTYLGPRARCNSKTSLQKHVLRSHFCIVYYCVFYAWLLRFVTRWGGPGGIEAYP